MKEDSLPLEILPMLREEFPEYEFAEFDAAENLEEEGEELTIIDAVRGIEKVTLISDVDALSESKRYTMHDFDLAITLKLLRKMNIVKSILIFGVPVGYGKLKAFEELKALIRANLS